MAANFFRNKSYNCKKRRNMKKRKNIKKRKNYGTIWMINLCLILVGTAIFVWYINVPDASPEETLKEYMSYISNQKYEQMYESIGVQGVQTR